MGDKIYESPDGGKTVYMRDIGTINRTLVADDNTPSDAAMQDNLFKYKKILECAKTNVALRDIIDQMHTIYTLVKNEKP